MTATVFCWFCRTQRIVVWTMEPCGHTACNDCLLSIKSTACSLCDGSIESFRCPGSQIGCQFNATQGTWKQHELKCAFVPVECPYKCESVVPKKSLSHHLNNECPLRPASCSHCGDSVSHGELNDHEMECPQALITCSFCKKENIKRGLLEDHASTCGKTPKPCPLNEYGCDFVGVASVMDEHLNVKNHVPCFHQMKKSLEERDAEIASLRNQLDTLMNESKECVADGAVLFDKELQWTVLIPNASLPPLGVDLTSPMFRHRNTKASFCFTLTSTEGSQHVTLKQHVLSPGVLWFTVKVEETSSEMKTPKKVAAEVTVPCKNQEILSWPHSSTCQGGFYVITSVVSDRPRTSCFEISTTCCATHLERTSSSSSYPSSQFPATAAPKRYAIPSPSASNVAT